MSKTMKLGVAGNPHNPGDVVHINDEAWAVYQATSTGNSSTVWLMPLRDYMANHRLISEAPWEMTIAEYLDKLCEEYESSCCC